ncbi:hypothetical protein GCM10020358_72280 [Amorphoplanes nipponensis]|uniref:Uncharacterized protein n=1 Tax=Actinoplanes nipponensis TaxID=135950 RepID=A0A919MM27_9ACTN|nr:hypothetical protein [Actinoplanes nipponensis]GIE46983.1 hypothetical protein Ani05nite_05170 [Actinoplanes nipponensis]
MTATLSHVAAPRAAAPAETPGPGDTARARLVLSAISLVALLIGVAGLLTGAGDLRAAGMLGYLLIGLGAAPCALSRRMGLVQRLAFTGGTSLAVLVGVSAVMLLGRLWQPMLFAAIVCAITAALHVAGIAAAVRELPARSASPWPAPPRALLLAVGGAALCGIAALTHRHLEPGLWGYLADIGPLWYLGLLLIVAALASARSAGELSLGLGVLLLMLVLTGTPALVYDGPRIQTAAKHLEFVQQIRDTFQLRTPVAVYNDWPGFFSAMAWLSDVAGLRDPMALATAWPAVIGVARVFAMRYFAGQLLDGRILPWLATGIGVLADPLGQDYFSPQSVGLVLGLLIVGVALSAMRVAARVTIMILFGSAVTVAHQLSPYIIGGTLCVLVAFGRLRPWWTPAAVLVPVLAWTGVHAGDLAQFVSLGSVGDVGNFGIPQSPVTPGLHKQPIVTGTLVAMLAGVLLVGLLALSTLIRDRRQVRTWALAVASAVGLVAVAINPYGNEGIFRAILFALPWLAVLAAPAVVRGAPAAAGRRSLAVLLTLCATFGVAAHGLDASNVLRRPDRVALHRFLATDLRPPAAGFLLLLGPAVLDLPISAPEAGQTHVVLRRSEIDPQGFALTGGSAAANRQHITDEFVSYTATRSPSARRYALWSPASSAYGWEYGMHTRQQFEGLRDSFAASPSWRVVYSSGGTVLFEYTGP